MSTTSVPVVSSPRGARPSPNPSLDSNNTTRLPACKPDTGQPHRGEAVSSDRDHHSAPGQGRQGARVSAEEVDSGASAEGQDSGPDGDIPGRTQQFLQVECQ